MKKSRIAILCLIALSFASGAGASNVLQGVIYPVQLFFNHVPQEVDDGYEIMNFNGHAYVPLRFIAEKTNSGIYYNDGKKSIDFYYPTSFTFSEKTSVQEENGFQLKLNSEKQKYNQDEVPRIWADLTYVGDNEVNVMHSTPILAFAIKDDTGRYWEQAHYDNLTMTTFQRFSQYRSDLSLKYIEVFHFQNSNAGSYEEFQNRSKNPYLLEPGTYDISVTATYQINNQPFSLKTSYKIEIE